MDEYQPTGELLDSLEVHHRKVSVNSVNSTKIGS